MNDINYFELTERILRGEALIIIAREYDLSTTAIDGRYKRTMMNAIRWHRKQGHVTENLQRLSVVRANPEFWLTLLHNYQAAENTPIFVGQSASGPQRQIGHLTIDEFRQLMTDIIRTVIADTQNAA